MKSNKLTWITKVQVGKLLEIAFKATLFWFNFIKKETKKHEKNQQYTIYKKTIAKVQ